MATLESHPAGHPLTDGRRPGRDAAPSLDGPGAAARAAARVGLYVHVPFCATRCTYCAFSSGAPSAAAVERYLDGIEREAARRAPAAAGVAFTSVFFGGGTPSALSARHFGRLWRALRSHFEVDPGAEITLEANPETVRPPLLEAWAAAGVNRLSMGAQSFDADDLTRLGRLHDAERPGQAFALARAHGFRRLSLDLMFGFPGHTLDRFASTIERALALSPEHLSAYCFIPEAGTSLGEAVRRGEAALPGADAQADLYEHLTCRLAAAGYGCYETSNFCRPGAEARHHLVYWLRRDYLGLGPSAHGLWRGVRHANHYDLDRWSVSLLDGSDCDQVEGESAQSRADEIVMLGLRLANGLAAADHPAERWREVRRRYESAFRAALATGRLEVADAGVRIPGRHRFVADDVIAWLMAAADRDARRTRHERIGFDRCATVSVP